MPKKGMKRASRTHTQERNSAPAVPEIQGRAKRTKEKANPIIADTHAPGLKVYHSRPHTADRPISSVYPELDTDLARDNVENDIPAADLQDL